MPSAQNSEECAVPQGSSMSIPKILFAQFPKCTSAWRHSCADSMYKKGYLPSCLLRKKIFYLNSKISWKFLKTDMYSSGCVGFPRGFMPKGMDLFFLCWLFFPLSFPPTHKKTHKIKYNIHSIPSKRKLKFMCLLKQARTFLSTTSPLNPHIIKMRFSIFKNKQVSKWMNEFMYLYFNR